MGAGSRFGQKGSTCVADFVQKHWVKGSKLLRSAGTGYGRKKEFGKSYQSLAGEALSKERLLQTMKVRE